MTETEKHFTTSGVKGIIAGLDHHVLLFVSSLAPGAAPDAVITIARQARRNNARTGITGLLVFDGEYFAQLMEGPAGAVITVVDRMASDPRHVQMEVLHSAATTKPRRFPAWQLGYLLMDLQEFGLQSLRGQRGAAALDNFNFMLPALDIAFGEAMPDRLRSGYR